MCTPRDGLPPLPVYLTIKRFFSVGVVAHLRVRVRVGFRVRVRVRVDLTAATVGKWSGGVERGCELVNVN